MQSVARTAGSGTLGLSDLAVVRVNGTPHLIGAGRYSDAPAFRPLSDDGGRIGSPTLATARKGNLSGLSEIEGIAAHGKTYVATGSWDRDGIHVYEVRSNLTLSFVARLPDTAKAYLADVSDLATAEIGGQTWIFASSSGESGVTSFRLNADGTVEMVDWIGAADGVGMAGTSALATAVVNGTTYLVAAASGTGTLTVFRVNAQGVMFQVDHVTDSLLTRFQGVVDIATFSYGGRSFVVAGGADDGLTLFEIGPGGKLYLMDVIANAPGWTVDNVQSIAVAVVGSEAQVFVAGSGAPGITQFKIDLGKLGPVLFGTPRDDALTGTARDDHIEGGRGDDRLTGGAGNDRLVDGPGADSMWGGAGADVFVFVKDGATDRIYDFQIGIDRIDLTAWPMLYSVDQLTITPTTDGARIAYRDEVIIIRTDDLKPLTAASFDNDDFIFS
jgi:Ca2+-binding RTX toxin-like protein